MITTQKRVFLVLQHLISVKNAQLIHVLNVKTDNMILFRKNAYVTLLVKCVQVKIVFFARKFHFKLIYKIDINASLANQAVNYASITNAMLVKI